MAVEAQSLAAITKLATEPPARILPSNGIEPLTLYIVRVPGSRDVFLSALKPGDRVVHAHDVQSSLYYLHLNGSGEPPTTPQGDRSRQDLNPRMTRIARKAIAAPTTRRPLPTPPASPSYGPPSLPPRPGDLEALPELPPRPDQATYNPQGLEQAPRMPPRPQEREASNAAKYTGNTMTLIRRDPSTGEQWNVAHIRDPPVHEVSSDTEYVSHFGSTKNVGAPVYIDIRTAGYQKFAARDTIVSPRSSYETDRTSSTISTEPDARSSAFERRLWMDASKFANHNYSTHRPNSVISLESTSPSKLSSSAAWARVKIPRQVDIRSKGYTFHDPWMKRCEFSTTAKGNALRCRRPVDGDRMESGAHVDDISELRFNLPTYHQRAKSDRMYDDQEHTSKRLSIFSNHSMHSTASLSTGSADRAKTDDDLEDMDYSLGRERAGGGFAGREPKLGKLIIYPGGLQMIDLVVASNLALWWRAYERCTPR